MGKHKVTVIIPVWDRPQMLWRSVYSALQQTHANMEILVIGDGCPSDVEQQYQTIVDQFQDDRVRWLYYPKHETDGRNIGGTASRNYGLQQVTGDFIAPLDDDDEWIPWHLERSLSIFTEHSDIDLVHGQWVNLSSKRQNVGIHGRGPTPGNPAHPLDGRIVGHLTAVYKAKWAHVEYPTTDPSRPADYRLWVSLYQAGAKFHFDATPHGIKYSKQ